MPEFKKNNQDLIEQIRIRRIHIENEIKIHQSKIIDGKNILNLDFRNNNWNADEKKEVCALLYLIWLSELLQKMEEKPYPNYNEIIDNMLTLPIEDLNNNLDKIVEVCRDFSDNRGIFAPNLGQNGLYRSVINQWSLGDITGTISGIYDEINETL